MATKKDFLQYILDQCPSGVTHRAMMGEYLLYFRGTLFGGLYDDRLLLKPTTKAKELLPGGAMEKPYEGAKPMLCVTDTDDRELLARLIEAVCDDLNRGKGV